MKFYFEASIFNLVQMKSLFKKEYKDKEAFVAKLSGGSSEISWN